jgi:hypothetical protein
VPMFLVAVFYFLTSGSDLDKMSSGNLFSSLKVMGGVALLWYLAALVQIVRKRDPLFDRMAGTAVLRRAPPVAPAGIKTVFE